MNNIIAAIEAAKNGYCYFPFSLNRFVGSLTSDQQNLLLIKQEISVMRYILDDKDNNDIAEKMFISNKTVSTYKSRLMEKLEGEITMDFYTFATNKSANQVFTLFFSSLLWLWSTISFADEDYIEYRGIKNNRVTLDPVRLSNKELRWLASKKNLVIAVHKSQTATLLHTDSQQQVRGINADYLNLLKSVKYQINTPGIRRSSKSNGRAGRR